MSRHMCHASSCTTPVPPRMFMCARHWRMVPKPMQDAIWAAYRPGQERDKTPSMAYLEAALAARGYVARAEDAARLAAPGAAAEGSGQ